MRRSTSRHLRSRVAICRVADSFLVEDETPVCRANGCIAAASYAVVWNNPKLHAPDREKIWVACEAHRQSLADHLDLRGFLLRVEPLTERGDEGGC